MHKEKLKEFWGNPNVSQEFVLLPAEAWEDRDHADYINYYWQYNFELQLCKSLGLDSDNFLSKYEMAELDNEEVIRNATE